MQGKTFTDQMGRSIHLTHPPLRVVSLVPSITEYLYDLMPEDCILGTTHYCVHPSLKVSTSQRIGGTKNLNADLVRSLQPDLIIGSKEENVKEQVEALACDFPVWMSDVKSVKDALDMMLQLGDVLGNPEAAAVITDKIAGGIQELPHLHKSVLYLIWRRPFMAAGNDTFIHDMLAHLHLQNVITSPRYPVIGREEMRHLEPELVLLSSEPYPFSEKHIPELRELFPKSEIILTDGEMYSWYGSRMLKAPAYFQQFFKS
jgi:ABC-type Fe3+-hydroxamate transport system substrate-binding protein